MKIGITGGAGFIGGYVAERAILDGHQVVIFDRRGRLPDSNWGSRCEVFLGDVRDEVAVSELAAHVDGIIHLAAVLGTKETIDDPRPANRTNSEGGLNFVMACRQHQIPGVNICVGNKGHKSTYPISKSAVEDYVSMFNIEHKTRINQVRAVNAYGPRQSAPKPYGSAKVEKITPSMVCRALLGEPIRVFGDGQQTSDMVHVRDVATALVKALEYAELGEVFKEPIGAGPSEHHTVNQVAEMIREIVYRLGGPEQPPIMRTPMRPGEPPRARVTVDNHLLRAIGITHLFPLTQGLEETITWFQDNWLPTYLGQRVDHAAPAVA